MWNCESKSEHIVWGGDRGAKRPCGWKQDHRGVQKVKCECKKL